MSDMIIGRFASRRDADLAIEALVQEHGIERTDVFVQSASGENSAGEIIDGADAESGHPDFPADGTPALRGAIEVSVDESAEAIRAALTKAGGELVV